MHANDNCSPRKRPAADQAIFCKPAVQPQALLSSQVHHAALAAASVNFEFSTPKHMATSRFAVATQPVGRCERLLCCRVCCFCLLNAQCCILQWLFPLQLQLFGQSGSMVQMNTVRVEAAADK